MKKQYIYNGETLKLTEATKEGLITLLDFHELFVKFKYDINQLVGRQEEGRLLLMMMFVLKEGGRLNHTDYPMAIQPLVEELINEMFAIIDICSDELALNELNFEKDADYKKKTARLLDHINKVENDKQFLLIN